MRTASQVLSSFLSYSIYISISVCLYFFERISNVENAGELERRDAQFVTGRCLEQTRDSQPENTYRSLAIRDSCVGKNKNP